MNQTVQNEGTFKRFVNSFSPMSERINNTANTTDGY